MRRPASNSSAPRGRAGRDADATRPVRTVFLKQGATTTLHRHEEPAAWMHVVAGEIVEERWSRDAEGGFVHERRVLRRGQSMAAPGETLHRVSAVGEAAFVTTSACDCGRAHGASQHEVDAVLRLARCAADLEWATTTAVGDPVPSITR